MYTYTYAFPKFLTVITATTLDICHVKYSLTLIGEKYFNIQLVITIYGTILQQLEITSEKKISPVVNPY